MEKQEKVRTCILLPEDVKLAIQGRALQLGMSMSKYIHAAAYYEIQDDVITKERKKERKGEAL